MRVRKMVGTALCTAMLVGSGAGAAFAGEVTGNGKPIDVQGKSECAYSGLDDVDEGEDVFGDDFGRTQNFGQIVKMAGPLGGLPGQACNPARAAR